MNAIHPVVGETVEMTIPKLRILKVVPMVADIGDGLETTIMVPMGTDGGSVVRIESAKSEPVTATVRPGRRAR